MEVPTVGAQEGDAVTHATKMPHAVPLNTLTELSTSRFKCCSGPMSSIEDVLQNTSPPEVGAIGGHKIICTLPPTWAYSST